MVIYTWWLNLVHPGRYLPRNASVFLDMDKTERVGPGWIDNRSTWQTFADPFDFEGLIKGKPAHEQFWTSPGNWRVAEKKDGRRGGKPGDGRDDVESGDRGKYMRVKGGFASNSS